MDRTLFIPLMLDTYKACQRAYELARSRFSGNSTVAKNGSQSMAAICKQFVRKGVAEINRGKITNNNQLQIFIGQHWPVDKMEKNGFSQDQIARSFLYTYKTLLHYVRCPYLPDGAEVVATAQKVRAKVHPVKVYMEDTFDLILWYPDREHLELVDFRLKLPQKIYNSYPVPSLLARHFLANKLRIRWPFKTLSVSTVKLTPKGLFVSETELKEETFINHFDDLVRDLEKMKAPSKLDPHGPSDNCSFCNQLSGDESQDESDLSMSA